MISFLGMNPLHKVERLIERILILVGLGDSSINKGLIKLSRFIISGGSAAAVNFIFLYVFTEYLGIFYLISAITSFILSSIVAFLMHKFWTYKNHGRDRIHKEFSFHFLVVSTNLALNTLLVYVFVEWTGLWYIWAQFITSIILAFESFFVLGWVFKHRVENVQQEI
jgi:putative flippase GtrA